MSGLKQHPRWSFHIISEIFTWKRSSTKICIVCYWIQLELFNYKCTLIFEGSDRKNRVTCVSAKLILMESNARKIFLVKTFFYITSNSFSRKSINHNETPPPCPTQDTMWKRIQKSRCTCAQRTLNLTFRSLCTNHGVPNYVKEIFICGFLVLWVTLHYII